MQKPEDRDGDVPMLLMATPPPEADDMARVNAISERLREMGFFEAPFLGAEPRHYVSSKQLLPHGCVAADEYISELERLKADVAKALSAVENDNNDEPHRSAHKLRLESLAQAERLLDGHLLAFRPVDARRLLHAKNILVAERRTLLEAIRRKEAERAIVASTMDVD